MYMSDLFYLFTSACFSDLTRDDGTNPSRSVVQRWLKSIGSKMEEQLCVGRKKWMLVEQSLNVQHKPLQ